MQGKGKKKSSAVSKEHYGKIEEEFQIIKSALKEKKIHTKSSKMVKEKGACIVFNFSKSNLAHQHLLAFTLRSYITFLANYILLLLLLAYKHVVIVM